MLLRIDYLSNGLGDGELDSFAIEIDDYEVKIPDGKVDEFLIHDALQKRGLKWNSPIEEFKGAHLLRDDDRNYWSFILITKLPGDATNTTQATFTGVVYEASNVEDDVYENTLEVV